MTAWKVNKAVGIVKNDDNETDCADMTPVRALANPAGWLVDCCAPSSQSHVGHDFPGSADLSYSGMTTSLSNPAYRPLPPDAANLLGRVSAPPRLIAHLIIVHDVAWRLLEHISGCFPTLTLDREAVLFGAATHDIGKALNRAELVQSGKKHEKHGVELLAEMGIPQERARFAYTHGNWNSGQNITLEDLLVALADNCWRGKRVDELESRTAELLSSASGKAMWTWYAELDKILVSLAADADSRLAWQGSFGI
jgi:putative nucleotidyltransferase with HDIG domain